MPRKLSPFEINPWIEKKSYTQEKAKELLKEEEGEKVLEFESRELLEKIDLLKQYESQKDILKDVGILKKLSSGELGIIGIDNKEYSLPKYEDIIKRMETKGEILKTKVEQGFTKLLIVPFGMKLDDLVKKYEQVILKHHKAGKLLATKEKPTDPDEKLELDESQPVWKWDGYDNADVEGKIVYFPKEFSENNHQGKTKQELLKGELSSGYNVLLIEDLPNIPREGKGKATKGRKQFEANKTPNEHLKTLRTDKQYQNEQGMTPEDQIIYAITHFEKTNQVIDDWKGKGSVSYQIGAWFPASGAAGAVPRAYWSRIGRRAGLVGGDPGFHRGSCSARVGVSLSAGKAGV